MSDKRKISSRFRGNDCQNPPILPPKRKRVLTTPLPYNQANYEQQTHSQEGCTFFNELSLEIRLMIYREVFGGRPIHIAYEYNELIKKWEFWSIECIAPDFRGDADECQFRWGMSRVLSPRPYKFTERISWAEINISLLMSCRRA